MAENDVGVAVNGHYGETLDMIRDTIPSRPRHQTALFTLPFCQKLIAEFLGTYFMVFAGCGVVVVNSKRDHVIGHIGIAIVWGLVVMVMIYSVGHISGAHFNPAVTIAFASIKRFPFKNVPAYIITQILGSLLASGTLRLIFNGRNNDLGATVPTGSDVQSLVLEFIITFYLMFVISCVATDDRAIGEAAGIAIGSTVLLNAMFAGETTVQQKVVTSEAKVFCECAEGWSCVVSIIDGPEAGKTYFECGEGCICVVDETNNVKVVCA
ncbi:major intrinsic protein, Aquaporin-like protein [Artemisia annua]|uniref:Major intrinsic protein, Aquaporin-like protein n=1 Tax=Artemisia annua TaxID=35608 RepID=A0A2U1LKW0_ARTAN|nr:major intrinsic protein, Aquaporin-like protein [Artemisia annua]